MKTIAIIGASGAIGRRVYACLIKSMDSRYRFVGTYYNKYIATYVFLDVTDPTSVKNFIINYRPYCIVWLCGTKDVRRCEDDPDFAFNIHTRPIEELIKAIVNTSLKTKVLFLSTDYVFDGYKGMYTDTDICSPKTMYGKSKYFAEKELINSCIDYLIIRTSAVMNRMDGFLFWFLNKLEKREMVNLYSNLYFTPTPIECLSNIICICIQKPNWANRIIHVAGIRKSRYQFGCELVHAMGIKNSSIMSSILDPEHTTFQLDLSLRSSEEFKLYMDNSWQELINEAKYGSVR